MHAWRSNHGQRRTGRFDIVLLDRCGATVRLGRRVEFGFGDSDKSINVALYVGPGQNQVEVVRIAVHHDVPEAADAAPVDLRMTLLHVARQLSRSVGDRLQPPQAGGLQQRIGEKSLPSSSPASRLEAAPRRDVLEKCSVALVQSGTASPPTRAPSCVRGVTT